MNTGMLPTAINDIRTGDTVRGLLCEDGLLWRMNDIKQSRVTDKDFMHALSRKQLEAFIEKLKGFNRAVAITFRAEMAFSVGEAHERELLTVKVELLHNTGYITMFGSRKLQRYDYPTGFTTRTETIRENKGALLIMGTTRNEDFAIWISPFENEA